MRIAIVSDVHGNMTALDAVIADLERVAPDLVLFGGDLTGLPRPAEVIDRIRELGWQGVLGNADEALWALDESPHTAAERTALKPQIDATRDLVGDERVQWLQALPREWKGHDVGLVHAVPGSLWTVVQLEADDATLEATYRPLDTAIAVYAHIHRPYIRRLTDFIVANTGSAGQPFDGDIRSSYLLIEDGEPQTRRVEYDLERELSLLKGFGYPVTDANVEARRRAVPRV